MTKTISLKLVSIQYSGKSVGEDIQLEILVADKAFHFSQRIKHDTVVTPDQILGQFQTETDLLEAPITLKVVENDLLFSDKGSTQSTIKLNTLAESPERFTFEVKVKEAWKLSFRRKTATFTIVFELSVGMPTAALTQLQQYNSPKGKNYNIYDREILAAVHYWSDVFKSRTNPPPVPLDPNLVKAMVFVESYVGQGAVKKGYYPPSPDVMQVANPADKAIHVFHNDGTEGVGREVADGKVVILNIPEANGDSPAESIKWGVRWLYYKAQKNVQLDGGWHTEWYSWKDAVKRYGPGTQVYQDAVIKVYEQGIDNRTNYKLWSVLLMLFLGAAIYGTVVTQQSADTAQIIPALDVEARVAGQSVIVPELTHVQNQPQLALSDNAKPFDSYGTAVKLARETFSPTGCTALGDAWQIQKVLDNCIYTVGTNWRPYWTAQLTAGRYRFTPSIIGVNYDPETDGPYAVDIVHIEQGDLTSDDVPDAVVVVNVSNGGVGHHQNMIVLARSNEGLFEQVANYMFDDREDIVGLFIDNNEITAHAWVKAYDDPQCCPSTYQTLRFKIMN